MFYGPSFGVILQEFVGVPGFGVFGAGMDEVVLRAVEKAKMVIWRGGNKPPPRLTGKVPAHKCAHAIMRYVVVELKLESDFLVLNGKGRKELEKVIENVIVSLNRKAGELE